MTVFEDEGRIVSLDWGWACDQAPTSLLRAAAAQLHAYFDGQLSGFDLPLAPAGTVYRQRVWDVIRAIPFGEARTYAGVAAQAGGSPRSVGRAVGSNPIPILIPCHRVLAWAGLGGFSGGDGLETKRWLLALEGVSIPPTSVGPTARQTIVPSKPGGPGLDRSELHRSGSGGRTP